MQFIVVFQPSEQFKIQGRPDDFADVELAEQKKAKAMYRKGIAQQIWAVQAERKGAIGLFEAASDEDLRDIVNSFPMVQHGYADALVFPVGPFVAFAE